LYYITQTWIVLSILLNKIERGHHEKVDQQIFDSKKKNSV